MAWTCTSAAENDKGQRVEYQQDKKGWTAWAETRDRVKVGSKVVHTGWTSDHKGYARYRAEIGFTEETS